MRYTSKVISYLSADVSSVASTVAFRRPTAGPELDIVNLYCEEHLSSVKNGNEELSVFIEPKLESGFPDIVAVYWDRTVADNWPAERLHLLPSDIPIIHYVNMAGSISVDLLTKRFGKRKASQMMIRLSDADVVNVQTNEITKKPLEEAFAIKRIVAIEAKVNDWQNGLLQAVQNTWFASESYLLMGSIPKSDGLLKSVENYGVGLVSKDQSISNPIIKSRTGNLPTSYASWIFNELAWKFS